LIIKELTLIMFISLFDSSSSRIIFTEEILQYWKHRKFYNFQERYIFNSQVIWEQTN